MTTPIVHRSAAVALLGGAQFERKLFNILETHTTTFVAADGGADHARAAGLSPDAVIGDLDSISDAARSQFANVVHHVDESDTTDFEKAVSRIDAPLILAAGFLGGRMDHSAAVINTLVRHKLHNVILLSDIDVCWLARPDTMQLSLAHGTRIALLPQETVRVTTSGLRWNLADATMHPAALISTSNETASEAVTISADAPLLITLPLACLAAAIAAVRAQ